MMGSRRSWAIALATAALWMLAASGPAVAAGGASVTTVQDGSLFGALVPGPDRLLWYAEKTDDSYGSRILRVGADGVTATTTVRGYSPSRGAQPRMLPDGLMGLVVDRLDETGGGIGVAGLAFMRLLPGSGGVASIIRLPHAVDDMTALAVAPDGAVWFANGCQDRLGRVAPSGRVTYMRLSAIRCPPDTTEVEGGAALAFDPKGALWFADFCTGRIARVSLAGRVRQWHELRAGCSFFGVDETLAADPRGGIFYAANGAEGSPIGLIHGGRLKRLASYGYGVFTSDGTLWRALSVGIERRDPDGSSEIVRGTDRVRSVSNLVPTPGGGVATVLATYWRADPNRTSHDAPVYAYLDGQVVSMRRDGSETSWALPDGGRDASSQLSGAYLALGPDGAFYVGEARVANPSFDWSSRLLRLLPDEPWPPRTARARVRAALGRVGRVAWLQLSCGAELARFCLATVRLTGRGVSRRPVRFALAGQSRGAVPIDLGGGALRQLRHDGKLRTTAIVRTDDGSVTRSPVTIGSKAPG
jgi:hypothetical protein